MGKYDQLVTITNEDSNASSKRKNSFRECAIQSGVNARSMIDAVNLEYQDLNQRDRPPNLYRGICKICGC